MYLQKLYRYNKWLFAAIVFFIAMQLLVTYKRGMVISPWYQYGMYSEKIYPEKIYRVNYQLGGPAWVYLMSPQMDDKINLTLDNLKRQPQNDTLYQKEICRLFQKTHLPRPDAGFYQAAPGWRVILSPFHGPLWGKASFRKIDSILVPATATWNGQRLTLENSTY